MKSITTLAVAALLFVSGESVVAAKPSGPVHSSKPSFAHSSHNVPHQPGYKQGFPNYQPKYQSYGMPKSFFPNHHSFHYPSWHFPHWGFGWNWHSPQYPMNYPYPPYGQ